MTLLPITGASTSSSLDRRPRPRLVDTGSARRKATGTPVAPQQPAADGAGGCGRVRHSLSALRARRLDRHDSSCRRSASVCAFDKRQLRETSRVVAKNTRGPLSPRGSRSTLQPPGRSHERPWVVNVI